MALFGTMTDVCWQIAQIRTSLTTAPLIFSCNSSTFYIPRTLVVLYMLGARSGVILVGHGVPGMHYAHVVWYGLLNSGVGWVGLRLPSWLCGPTCPALFRHRLAAGLPC